MIWLQHHILLRFSLADCCQFSMVCYLEGLSLSLRRLVLIPLRGEYWGDQSRVSTLRKLIDYFGSSFSSCCLDILCPLIAVQLNKAMSSLRISSLCCFFMKILRLFRVSSSRQPPPSLWGSELSSPREDTASCRFSLPTPVKYLIFLPGRVLPTA